MLLSTCKHYWIKSSQETLQREMRQNKPFEHDLKSKLTFFQPCYLTSVVILCTIYQYLTQWLLLSFIMILEVYSMTLGYIVWYRDSGVWCSFSAFHQCVSALAGGRLKAQHYLKLLFTFVYTLSVACCMSWVGCLKAIPQKSTERQKRVHEWKSKEGEIEGFAGDVSLQVRLSCLRQKYLMLLSDLCIFIHSPILLDSPRNSRENFFSE